MSATAEAPVNLVIGPRTRLGAALVDQVAAAGGRTVVFARHATDATHLESGPGQVIGTDADATAIRALVGDRPVRLFVCALGPVQSGDHADTAGVVRDLALVGRVLASAGGRPVAVVLVSTVIALAPGADRRYYGGWKALVEGEVRALVEQHPGAALTVLYPGRLVADTRRPAHRVHTTYARLAALVQRAADGHRSSRVVGLDARLWLLSSAVRLGLGAAVPTQKAPRLQPAESRERPPVTQEITS